MLMKFQVGIDQHTQVRMGLDNLDQGTIQ